MTFVDWAVVVWLFILITMFTLAYNRASATKELAVARVSISAVGISAVLIAALITTHI